MMPGCCRRYVDLALGGTSESPSNLEQISVEAQHVLSVAHNNLNLGRMAAGITVVILVVFFLLSALGFQKSEHSTLHRRMSGAVVLFHGITMFSSRLVEEEHRFWYWASLAWFVYLGLRWYDYPAMLSRFTMDNTSHRSRLPSGTRVGALLLPLLHVLGQSVNPAGETPWGAGTYLHGFLDASPLWLWILAGGAHVLAVQTLSEAIGVAVGVGRYASTFGACLVCGLTVLFKICSTHTFNPELLEFLPPWLQSIFSEEVGNLALWSLWSGLLALCIVLLVRYRTGTVSANQAASPGLSVDQVCS
jgi:ethanolaminephosphotransferase